MRIEGRAAIALGLAAVGVAAMAATPPYNPADAARGKTLVAQCIVCHGEANPPVTPPGGAPFHPPKLAGQRAEAIFYALRDYASGARKSAFMEPVAQGLSVQDMRDLGAYLSAGGPHLPKTAGQTSAAHDKVHRDCTDCHGESGMGVMPGIPVLTGQTRDYLLHALGAYRTGERTNPTMGPIAAKLSPAEVDELATYFSIQEHLRTSQ